MPSPKASTLKDSFDQPSLSGCWWADYQPGATPSHGPALSPPSTVTTDTPNLLIHADNSVNAFTRFTTNDTFDLVDDTCTFHFDSIVGSGFLEFDIYNGCDYKIFLETPDTMFFGDFFGSGVTITVSPVPLWWRFRYDSGAGTLYFETSLDGVAWTVQHSVVPTFAPENVLFQLWMEPYVVTLDVRVLSYNGGGSPVCPSAPGSGSFAFTTLY